MEPNGSEWNWVESNGTEDGTEPNWVELKMELNGTELRTVWN